MILEFLALTPVTVVYSVDLSLQLKFMMYIYTLSFPSKRKCYC